MPNIRERTENIVENSRPLTRSVRFCSVFSRDVDVLPIFYGKGPKTPTTKNGVLKFSSIFQEILAQGCRGSGRHTVRAVPPLASAQG